MTEAGQRDAVAWHAAQTATELAKHAQAVGLDTLAYLLEMAAMEAKQYVAVHARSSKEFQ